MTLSRGVQPLWTWPVSLVLAVMILIGLRAWSDTAHNRFMAHLMNLGRLSADRSVVVLGDSKVRCGILFDDQMDKVLAARGEAAPFHRIARGGALFGDFASTFDILEKTKPALVLLQADFFTLEPSAFRIHDAPVGPDWRQQARASLHVSSRGDAAFPDQYGADNNRRPEGDSPCNDEDATFRTPAVYRSDMAGRRTSTLLERHAVLARVRRLQARGVPVILLDMPRSAAAEQAFPADLAQGVREILQRDAAANHIPVLAPPRLPDEDFLDTAHLNGAGRAAYSAWLADQIAGRLARSAAG